MILFGSFKRKEEIETNSYCTCGLQKKILWQTNQLEYGILNHWTNWNKKNVNIPYGEINGTIFLNATKRLKIAHIKLIVGFGGHPIIVEM